MPETEGTIQFAYDLQPTNAAVCSIDEFAQLHTWRGILKSLDLLGQHPSRYEGYAYGNISCKSEDYFVITHFLEIILGSRLPMPKNLECGGMTPL